MRSKYYAREYWVRILDASRLVSQYPVRNVSPHRFIRLIRSLTMDMH